jgi:cobalamin biosynthesis protein CobT
VCASERATQLAAGTTARQEKAKREVMKDSEEEEEDDEAEQEEDDEDEESDESDESEEDERAIDKILCIRRKKEKAANGEDKAKLEAGEKGKEKGKDKKKESEETPSKRQMKDGFGDSIEILVKWKDRAYIHSEWIDERTVLRLARIKYLNFLRSLVQTTAFYASLLSPSLSRLITHSRTSPALLRWKSRDPCGTLTWMT